MRTGVVQLHRWGLLDDVIAAGTPAVRSTTFTFADEEVRITIKPSHGVDALYAPRRTVLDPILVDAARAAGASFDYGTSITDVVRDRTGRVVGVDGRDSRGRAVRHDARWIVGPTACARSSPTRSGRRSSGEALAPPPSSTATRPGS